MTEQEQAKLFNAANDWRYLMTLASRGLTGREAVMHSRRTTKGDLDAWLMRRFGLSQTEARDISNYSMEQIDFRTGRPGELFWTCSRPVPTWEDYPELREVVTQ